MKPNSDIRQRIVRHWPLYAIIALPTAFLLVFSYWPMIGVQIAFRNFNPVQGIWGSPWVGLQQFELFLSSPYFWPLVKNTLVLSLYYLIVSIPCSLILALALNEVKHVRFKKPCKCLLTRRILSRRLSWSVWSRSCCLRRAAL